MRARYTYYAIYCTNTSCLTYVRVLEYVLHLANIPGGGGGGGNVKEIARCFIKVISEMPEK